MDSGRDRLPNRCKDKGKGQDKKKEEEKVETVRVGEKGGFVERREGGQPRKRNHNQISLGNTNHL